MTQQVKRAIKKSPQEKTDDVTTIYVGSHFRNQNLFFHTLTRVNLNFTLSKWQVIQKFLVKNQTWTWRPNWTMTSSSTPTLPTLSWNESLIMTFSECAVTGFWNFALNLVKEWTENDTGTCTCLICWSACKMASWRTRSYNLPSTWIYPMLWRFVGVVLVFGLLMVCKGFRKYSWHSRATWLVEWHWNDSTTPRKWKAWTYLLCH